jgi:hypothetical protein
MAKQQQISDAEVVKAPEAAAEQQPELQIEIDPAAAIQLKLQEFDKKITESEAAAAEYKRQKAAFIYDSNVQFLVQQHKAKETAGQAPADQPVQG